MDKLLEDACLKLSVVASDIFGVSGRAMMAALIAGERDPTTWPISPAAGCGPRSVGWRSRWLGTFDDHHRFLLARMLARVDAVCRRTTSRVGVGTTSCVGLGVVIMAWFHLR